MNEDQIVNQATQLLAGMTVQEMCFSNGYIQKKGEDLTFHFKFEKLPFSKRRKINKLMKYICIQIKDAKGYSSSSEMTTISRFTSLGGVKHFMIGPVNLDSDYRIKRVLDTTCDRIYSVMLD